MKRTELKTPSVPALERALNALELLAQSKSGLLLPELCKRLGLPKSSTHSLLVTLERRGYLQRNAKTNRYLFGLKLFGMANMALAGLELREKSTPFLRALMARTHLTVHLAVLDRNEGVLIEKVEPLGVYKLATWLGKRMDVHCTGLGKALIAYVEESELDELVRQHGLPRHNENTIASLGRLKQQLAKIRLDGYSIDDEEDEIGYRCIGAPVFGRDGKILAAVSVSGTMEQVTAQNQSELADQVKQCAASISALLGLEGPG